MALLESNCKKSALFSRGELFFSFIIMFGEEKALPLKRELFSKTALQESRFTKKGWKQLSFFQKSTILAL